MQARAAMESRSRGLTRVRATRNACVIRGADAKRMRKIGKLLEDDGSTLRPMLVPRVLIVGGPESLVSAVKRVAADESPAIAVDACDLAQAVNVTTAKRPFAVVMSQDVYGFDPGELAALVRDVQAELVVVKVNKVTPGFLEQALRPSLRHAFRRYRTVIESGPVRNG